MIEDLVRWIGQSPLRQQDPQRRVRNGVEGLLSHPLLFSQRHFIPADQQRLAALSSLDLAVLLLSFLNSELLLLHSVTLTSELIVLT